jgi:hypothetical protein
VELSPVSLRIVEDEALLENTAVVSRPGLVQPAQVRTLEVARRRGDGRWVYTFDTAAAE